MQRVEHEPIFELVCDREQRRLRGSYEVHDLERQYVATRIREALAELSPVLRQALLLYADGMSYVQIADLTKANIGTVRSCLHYARKKARGLLTDLQYRDELQAGGHHACRLAMSCWGPQLRRTEMANSHIEAAIALQRLELTAEMGSTI